MALSGSRKHTETRAQHDDQRRTGYLYQGRVRHPPGRRHAHHGEWRGIVYATKSVTGESIRESDLEHLSPVGRGRDALGTAGKACPERSRRDAGATITA